MKKNTFYLISGLIIVILFLIHQNDKIFNIKIFNIDSDDDDDDEYEKDIIDEPKRYYDSKYYSRKRMRINVPTRGEPPPYQQVGILTDTTNPENVKPLYGRQTYRGSNQWNYFTSLDSHLATKIPIELNNKDCTDERGCTEINKNDTLNISTGDNLYRANIYQTHSPRYIPY